MAVDEVLGTVQRDIAARLPDGMAHYIATHGHRYRFDLANILPRLPAGARVLDLGAYPFCMAETLARLGHDVTGAGLGPEPPRGLACKTERVDCDRSSLPFDDESFDAIVFSEIFEHLYVNPLGVIEEIHRVLKPGGFLYLTTPNALGIKRLCRTLRTGTQADDVVAALKGIKAGDQITHFREYTVREIRRILEHAGFTVEIRTASPYRKQALESRLWDWAGRLIPNGGEVVVAIGLRHPDFADRP